MDVNKHKCEHGPCTCVIEAGDLFCSPQCEEQAAIGRELPCECGHATCEMGGEIPAEVALAT